MPFLGCCYGLGILAAHLGARSRKARYGEPVGGVDCAVTEAGAADPLLAGLPRSFRALVGHKEAVQALPPGAVHLVASEPCPFQVIRAGRNVYATQFHPEADGGALPPGSRSTATAATFPPETADALTATVLAERPEVPALLLRRFARRYAGA